MFCIVVMATKHELHHILIFELWVVARSVASFRLKLNSSAFFTPVFPGSGIKVREKMSVISVGEYHTGMCISVYSSTPSFSSNVGSASSPSSCRGTQETRVRQLCWQFYLSVKIKKTQTVNCLINIRWFKPFFQSWL